MRNMEAESSEQDIYISKFDNKPHQLYVTLKKLGKITNTRNKGKNNFMKDIYKMVVGYGV